MRIFAILIIFSIFYSCNRNIEIFDLKCENLVSPCGIDSPVPKFSWKIKSSENGTKQYAYQIEVATSINLLKNDKADIWQSGQVVSSSQIMIPFEGKSLESRHIYYWRVKIWDSENSHSHWSNIERFSVGIIGNDKISGAYIGAGNGAIVRKKISISNDYSNAMLYVNSLGYHEAYINGEKVSDAVLMPAVSQLDSRSLIITYDVTELLHQGENDISFILSSGWYKPKTFNAKYDGGLVRADLDIDNRTILSTDSSWEGRESGYQDIGDWSSWHFEGERIDANIIPISMKSDALDKMEWHKVDTVHIEGISSSQQMCEPCKIQETIEAVSIEQISDSIWLADMGKVVNAMAEITLPGLPKGHETIVKFSDHKSEDGTLFEISKNVLVSRGGEEEFTFTNKFNHHVFRYVTIYGLPEQPNPSTIKALRMRTDFQEASTFECSDSDLNNIEKMVSWTMENLAFNGYMVDCANIERLGYGGDGNASTLSLQTKFAVSPLYTNWMMAWNDVMEENGSLPHTAPSPYKAGGGPYWCSFIIQAPWRTYMSYADDRLLERYYPAMKKWLGYVDLWSSDGLLYKWEDTDKRHWFLGDWLAPKDIDVTAEESVNIVNNCMLSQCYAELVNIASHLNLGNDIEYYSLKLKDINRKIHDNFYHPEDTIYGTGSQIDMIYPLLVGAVPEQLQVAITEKLNKLSHIGVGLTGIPILTEWATLSENSELIYRFLKQTDYPGYLYMLNHGGTGTWESWDGRRSRMHNCYNGICSWFYQGLGGIRPVEPGYRKVLIKPQIPDVITWAKITQKTPYGDLKVDYEKDTIEKNIIMDISIPVGVTAIINDRQFYSGKYNIKYNEN